MRSPLKRSAAPLAAVALLMGCAHPENYRWSENSRPRFSLGAHGVDQQQLRGTRSAHHAPKTGSAEGRQ